MPTPLALYGEVRGILGAAVAPLPALELEAAAGVIEDLAMEEAD